ncbi:MAG: YmdB family metallophosphoesterase, partial [Pirellulales bacterium]|nr:YmdB family metallophosphoesterase [Pirellulales bacterium]
MRVLFIGDIVGQPGRDIVRRAVPHFLETRDIDFVVANGENSAGGSGITPTIYRELIDCGVNVITLGDHIYRRRAIIPILESRENIVRPANYPPEAPGREFAHVTSSGDVDVAVISVM